MEKFLTSYLKKNYEGWYQLEETTNLKMDESFGSNVLLPESRSIDIEGIFECIFDQTVMNEIIQKTNEKHRNTSIEIMSSHHIHWRDLSVEELKVFIGVFIMMGINKFPDYRMHWSKNLMWNSNLIKSSMPIDRFEQISHYLSLGDKNIADPLARI